MQENVREAKGVEPAVGPTYISSPTLCLNPLYTHKNVEMTTEASAGGKRDHLFKAGKRPIDQLMSKVHHCCAHEPLLLRR